MTSATTTNNNSNSNSNRKSKQSSMDYDPNDKFFGRRDICLLTQSTVEHLFPLNPSSPSSSRNPPSVSEWLAYVYYRTNLSLPTIFHAFHLLRRLSLSFQFDPEIASPLVHHRLILTALLLATKYQMDDSYSNKSWATASKGLFDLKEVNEMEYEMLESLNWKIGFDCEEKEGLVEVLEEYEREFSVWTKEFHQAEEQLKRKREEENKMKLNQKQRNHQRSSPYSKVQRHTVNSKPTRRGLPSNFSTSSTSSSPLSPPANFGEISD